MAMVRMKADGSKESSGDFPIAPDGDYILEIRKAIDGSASSGSKNPGCQKVDLIIDLLDQVSEEVVGSVYQIVTFIPEERKGHGIWLHFNHAFGMPYDGEVNFDTADYIGKRSRGRIFSEVYNGKNRNKIGELYIADGEEGDGSGNPPASAPPASSSKPPVEPVDLEEVPF